MTVTQNYAEINQLNALNYIFIFYDGSYMFRQKIKIVPVHAIKVREGGKE
jgi:hypothetical protein